MAATDLFTDLFLTSELNDTEQRALRRMARAGEAQRVAPEQAAGIYSGQPASEWPEQIRRHRVRVLSHLFPNGVLSYRSAFEGSLNAEKLFLSFKYRKTVNLPGVVIDLFRGAGPQPGDQPLSQSKIYLPSVARMFLDNLSVDRSGLSRNASLEDLEGRLISILRSRNEQYFNAMRSEAQRIAASLDRDREYALLDTMMGSILGTRPDHRAKTPTARAMAMGIDYDRLTLFDLLVTALQEARLTALPDSVKSDDAKRNFAFLESYFSNYIEGTKFPIDQAIGIALRGNVAIGRPKDARDLIGVYNHARDPGLRALTMPQTDAVLAAVQEHHLRMMLARPEIDPGTFKTMPNMADNHTFVHPDFVRETLCSGVKKLGDVLPGSARALLSMLVFVEVHPFNDGNGRLARLLMNAELTHAGESRIIIPTLYRDEYLDGLRAMTQQRDPTTYIRMMRMAQEWTASFDYSDLQTVIAQMKKCNAFEENRTEFLLLDRSGQRIGSTAASAMAEIVPARTQSTRQL